MWPLEDIDIIRWSGWRARSFKAVSIWDGRCKDLVELLPLLPISQLEISAIPTLPLGLVGLLQWLTDPREMGLSVPYQYITNSATKNKTATWWTRSVRSGLEKKPEHPSPLWVCHSPGSSTCSALQRLSPHCSLWAYGGWVTKTPLTSLLVIGNSLTSQFLQCHGVESPFLPIMLCSFQEQHFSTWNF